MEMEHNFDVVDVLRALRSRKEWVIGLPALFATVVLSASFFMRPQWEAQALIEPGRFPKAVDQQNTDSVESIMMIRMASRNFRVAVLSKLGIGETTPSGALYMDSLRGIAPANSSCIRMTLRAYSPEEAQKLAQATVDNLVDADEHVFSTQKKMLSEQLQELDKQIARVSENLPKRGEGSTELATLGHAYLKANLLGALGSLFDTRIAYEYRLDPTISHPAKLTDPIYVDRDPVFPRRVWLTGGAAAVGFVLGLLIALALGPMRSILASIPEVRQQPAVRSKGIPTAV